MDIGSGFYPLFLVSVDFSEKYGLDKEVRASVKEEMKGEGITLVSHDIENEEKFPFEDNFFDVVTMLAVFEHISPNKLVGVLKEIKRVLKPNGRFILTTPAAWTDKLLRFMAKLRLISSEEIQDHKGESIVAGSQKTILCDFDTGVKNCIPGGLESVTRGQRQTHLREQGAKKAQIHGVLHLRFPLDVALVFGLYLGGAVGIDQHGYQMGHRRLTHFLIDKGQNAAHPGSEGELFDEFAIIRKLLTECVDLFCREIQELFPV